MKFSTVFLSTLSLVAAAAAAPSAELDERAAAVTTRQQVTYDPVYDVKKTSLNTVACSNGRHGLIGQGYTTFGSLPNWPYIGGAQVVAGWNSPNCGTCWEVTWRDTTIYVLAIDHADSGFNIGKKAMNVLTGNQAEDLGVVNAKVKQVKRSNCGL